MANFVYFRLLDACREPGCPVCRVEQFSVERYLENQFYENVNSPKWRDRLRPSLGFCHEHAWLAVDRRLGDALGLSIIYRDILNSILRNLEQAGNPARSTPTWIAILRQVPEQARTFLGKVVEAMTPAAPCPVCEHLEQASRSTLSVLAEGLEKPELLDALRASDGLCLPHFRRMVAEAKNLAAFEELLSMQREKMEGLRAELDEYIRKSDYQEIEAGFGREGDAWLRAIALVAGSKRK